MFVVQRTNFSFIRIAGPRFSQYQVSVKCAQHSTVLSLSVFRVNWRTSFADIECDLHSKGSNVTCHDGAWNENAIDINDGEVSLGNFSFPPCGRKSYGHFFFSPFFALALAYFCWNFQMNGASPMPILFSQRFWLITNNDSKYIRSSFRFIRLFNCVETIFFNSYFYLRTIWQLSRRCVGDALKQ